MLHPSRLIAPLPSTAVRENTIQRGGEGGWEFETQFCPLGEEEGRRQDIGQTRNDPASGPADRLGGLPGGMGPRTPMKCPLARSTKFHDHPHCEATGSDGPLTGSKSRETRAEPHAATPKRAMNFRGGEVRAGDWQWVTFA